LKPLKYLIKIKVSMLIKLYIQKYQQNPKILGKSNIQKLLHNLKRNFCL